MHGFLANSNLIEGMYTVDSEKAMAPHSSTLAWKIPWTEEPGMLQPMGSLSWIWLSDFTFSFHFHALEKEMATHSSVLAWRVPVMVKPGGLPSMGSNRVGHDWNNLAAAAYSWLMHGWCSMVHAHCWTRESLVYRKECSSESLGAVVEDLREGKFNRSGSQRREDGLRWKQDSGRKQGTLQIFFFFSFKFGVTGSV